MMLTHPDTKNDRKIVLRTFENFPQLRSNLKSVDI